MRRSFSAFRDKIESPVLIAVANHWEEVCAGRRVPAWSDIRPSAIAPHLTRVWSFKYDRASGEFTARLAGNQVTLGFGISFRGTPLRDLHPPHVFEKVQANMTRLVLGPCLYRGHGRLFRMGDHVTEGERIILPLSADGEHCDGALGASDFVPLPSTVPRKPVELIHDVEQWFSLTDA